MHTWRYDEGDSISRSRREAVELSSETGQPCGAAKKSSKALDKLVECGIMLAAGEDTRKRIRASPVQGGCPAGPRGRASKDPQKSASPPAGELAARSVAAPQPAEDWRGGKVSNSEPDWRKPGRIGESRGVQVSHCEFNFRQNGRTPESTATRIRGG